MGMKSLNNRISGNMILSSLIQRVVEYNKNLTDFDCSSCGLGLLGTLKCQGTGMMV